MGRLFLRFTPLEEFEVMMQERPRRSKHIPVSELSYLQMLHIIINEYKVKGLYKKVKKIIGGGDGNEMLFISPMHKNRFNQFYKYAEKNGWKVINSNKNLAAIFLLSACDHLWSQSKNLITRDAVLIDTADIYGNTEEVYDVFQAIRFILYGAKKLALADLAEPEIIADDVVLLITNSFVVNKYGIIPLQNPHKRTRTVN